MSKYILEIWAGAETTWKTIEAKSELEALLKFAKSNASDPIYKHVSRVSVHEES